MLKTILANFLITFLIKHVNGNYAAKKSFCIALPPRDNTSIIKLHNRTVMDDGIYPEGTHVSFYCVHRNDGVRGDDDGKLICKNGTWHGNLPRCRHYPRFSNRSSYRIVTYLPTTQAPESIITCRKKPEILLGSIIDTPEVEKNYSAMHGYREGTTLSVVCRIGHIVPKPYKLICHKGIWKGIPQCVVSQCFSPGNVVGGEWTVIGHNPLLPIVQRGWILEGVRIEYVCRSGNVLVGSKWRDCLPSGNWSGQEGLCIPKEKLYLRCNAPGHIPHGRITCTDCGPDRQRNFFTGTVLTVSCLSGYGMLGGADVVQLRCIFPDEVNASHPRWSRRLPKCLSNEELLGSSLTGGSVWSQDLAVVIAVSTVVMGGLLMIFTAVLACRCVRQAAAGRRGRAGSPLHHHPYTVSAASMAAGHSFLRNEDCVALIVPPSYEEAIREGGQVTASVSRGTAGPASTMSPDGVTPMALPNSGRGGAPIHNSRFAHVLSRSPRIRAGGESRDYRPLVPAPNGSRQSRRAAAASAATASVAHQHQGHHVHGHHHHGNIPMSSGEADSVSRHSTQTSGSHGPAYCLSGSLETMAVSDGTSVTLRTYESQHGGSNPSLVSTRPQTGSVGEPQQSWQSPAQPQAFSRPAGDNLGSSVGSGAIEVVVLPSRHATQALSGGNGCVTSAGSIVSSEKEDSISTRS